MKLTKQNVCIEQQSVGLLEIQKETGNAYEYRTCSPHNTLDKLSNK